MRCAGLNSVQRARGGDKRALPSLDYIDLDNNQIGGAGLTALAPALRKLPRLETLWLDNNQITDYLVREVQPKLATVNGVQRARILGDRTFAMRAWQLHARGYPDHRSRDPTHPDGCAAGRVPDNR